MKSKQPDLGRIREDVLEEMTCRLRCEEWKGITRREVGRRGEGKICGGTEEQV